MDRQKFKLSQAQRTLLKAFCKKKWLKKEVNKTARKIRYIKESPAPDNPVDEQSRTQEPVKIKKEVIDITTTKTSADEFLDITEDCIGRLFYQDLPAESPHELRDRCKKIDELLIPLIMELSPEHLELISDHLNQGADYYKPALESLRDANHALFDTVSGHTHKGKLNEAADELTVQLALAYQKLFNEKPSSTNKFYHYIKMAVDLIGNDFDHKIKISPKRIKKILKKRVNPKTKTG
ncbi:MAG: hypothetical protein EP297_11425 [Gammaproteobacteria bacterium]|nr:MAG: hypothetical protein EP297_11425 [Gammaproteobacteria bacterium]